MTKVIKGEFEKPESQKINDDSFTFNTSFEFFHEEFNRMSRMDDDLFTYEVEISRLANIPCDLNKEDDSKQQMTHGSGDDMEYDPSNARGDDEVELTDKESSNSDDEDEGAQIFRIDTNDNKLKEEALKNKAIVEGIIDEDDESSNEVWRRWDNFENTNHDHAEREYEMEHENEEICELFDDQEWPVCNIRRFKMNKYSFSNDEEYVSIKENEYDDLTSTNEDACLTYQEIFRRKDKGWMVTRAE
nr:hypothetical protein [Tanacetum cinerariifolium]